MNSLAERVWFAFNCLPREKGTLPKPKPWEARHGLSNGQLLKICTGTEPSASTLAKLATALGVTTDWLVYGTGQPPRMVAAFIELSVYRGQEEKESSRQEDDAKGKAATKAIGKSIADSKKSSGSEKKAGRG